MRHGYIEVMVPMRLTVRLRVIFLLLVGSMLPITLVGFVAVTRIESRLVDGIVADQRRLIEQIRLDLDSEFTWYSGQLDALARQVPVRSLAVDNARQVMEVFLAFHAVFHEVIVYDASGRRVVSAARSSTEILPPTVTELPVAVQEAFRQCLQDGSVRKPVGVPRGGDLDLHLLTPVPSLRRKEGPVGVVIGRVRRGGGEIQDIVDTWKYIGDTHVHLTTENGDVVARAGSAKGRNIRHIRIRPGPDGIEGVSMAGMARFMGRKEVVASVPLTDHGLVVVVGSPYAEVSTTLDDLVASTGTHLLLGLIAALLLGVGLSRQLVRPIAALTEGILKVARGEMVQSLVSDREDELGDATRAFNELTRHLQKGRLLDAMWKQQRLQMRERGP